MSPELSKSLARLRTASRLTQEEMSARVGVERPSISRIEHGQNTTVSVLEAWAAACSHRVELVKESDTILSTPGLTAEHRALIERMTRILPSQAPGETYVFDAILDAMERRKGRS